MPTTPTDPPLTLASPANSTTLVTAETLIIPAPFPAYSTPRVETPASQEVQDVQRPLVTQYPRQQHQSHRQQQGTNDQRGTAAIIKVPGDTPDEGGEG